MNVKTGVVARVSLYTIIQERIFFALCWLPITKNKYLITRSFRVSLHEISREFWEFFRSATFFFSWNHIFVMSKTRTFFFARCWISPKTEEFTTLRYVRLLTRKQRKARTIDRVITARMAMVVRMWRYVEANGPRRVFLYAGIFRSQEWYPRLVRRSSKNCFHRILFPNKMAFFKPWTTTAF